MELAEILEVARPAKQQGAAFDKHQQPKQIFTIPKATQGTTETARARAQLESATHRSLP